VEMTTGQRNSSGTEQPLEGLGKTAFDVGKLDFSNDIEEQPLEDVTDDELIEIVEVEDLQLEDLNVFLERAPAQADRPSSMASVGTINGRVEELSVPNSLEKEEISSAQLPAVSNRLDVPIIVTNQNSSADPGISDGISAVAVATKSSALCNVNTTSSSSVSRCTATFLLVTAALAFATVIFDFLMSRREGSAKVCPASFRSDSGEGAMNPRWPAFTGMFSRTRRPGIQIEDHLDVSGMDLNAMRLRSESVDSVQEE
jgi:hypothetical protein